MSELLEATGDAPEVIVQAYDRVSIRGWDRLEVFASGPEERVSLEVDGNVVRVTGDVPFELKVPHNASIRLSAGDDATVRQVQGGLHVDQVGGNLTLREVGEVFAETVGDDCTARSVHGNLALAQVGRYLTVREVNGNFSAENVGSHATVKGVTGGLRLRASGNVTLLLDAQPESDVEVRASGGLICQVETGFAGQVHLDGSGPIRVRVGERREVFQPGEHELTLGEGGVAIHLQADGPISLHERSFEDLPPEFDVDFDLGEDFAGLGAAVGEELSEQLRMMEEVLEDRLTGFADLVESWELPPEKAERLQKRTQEKVLRAQEKIRRAQRRAAKKIAQAQRNAERERQRAQRKSERVRARSFKFDLSDGIRGGGKRSEPVREEERLMILNMLAEKKISLEEAEKLLAALEGEDA